MFEKSYGTSYDFLRITKILKKHHMIPPMIFDKTIQQYNIFVWYSLKNIHINFLKCLYIYPPPEIFKNWI